MKSYLFNLKSILALFIFIVSFNLKGQEIDIQYVQTMSTPPTATTVTFDINIKVPVGSVPTKIASLLTSLGFPDGSIQGTIIPVGPLVAPFNTMPGITWSIAQGTADRVRGAQANAAEGVAPILTETYQKYATVTVTSTGNIVFPLTLTPMSTGNPTLQSTVYLNGASTTTAITLAAGTINITDSPTITFAAPLPIKIRDLSAFAEGKRNAINWSTSSEYNNDVQIVEASNNGSLGWRTIAKVKSKNSASGASYEVFDTKPSLLTYYRIRSIDYDGQEQYSAVVSVLREAIKTSHLRGISPVPANGFITADIELATENDVTYRIIDATGKELISNTNRLIEGNNNLSIDISELSAGSYTLIVTSADLRASEQFVKN